MPMFNQAPGTGLAGMTGGNAMQAAPGAAPPAMPTPQQKLDRMAALQSRGGAGMMPGAGPMARPPMQMKPAAPRMPMGAMPGAPGAGPMARPPMAGPPMGMASGMPGGPMGMRSAPQGMMTKSPMMQGGVNWGGPAAGTMGRGTR
jgi:hypothetical protein